MVYVYQFGLEGRQLRREEEEEESFSNDKI